MTVKENVSIEETIDFLNELINIDRKTISALMSMRINCNKELADHPTVQVRKIGSQSFQVGMIGLLNGLFGIDGNGYGHISAEYDDGELIKFELVKDKFERVANDTQSKDIKEQILEIITNHPIQKDRLAKRLKITEFDISFYLTHLRNEGYQIEDNHGLIILFKIK